MFQKSKTGNNGLGLMTQYAIRGREVVKKYPLFTSTLGRVRYIQNLIFQKGHLADNFESSFSALQGISFDIKKGERVGIVGRNGSGKSTLLQLIAGDFRPSKGSLEVNGNVYSMLPGSVNFSLPQTVKENIEQHLGYFDFSRSEIAEKLVEIEDFVELGEYFHQPVKNLSLGMQMRAEFAVSTSHSSEILIVDEVLGAGDIYWAEKLAKRMEQQCAEGKTLLLVSHSLPQVHRFCDRCIWIDNGEIVEDGPSKDVVSKYEGFLERLRWLTDDLDDKTVDAKSAQNRNLDYKLPLSGQIVQKWPSRELLSITGVWLNGKTSNHLDLSLGDELTIDIHFKVLKRHFFNLRVLITFWDMNGKRFAVVENENADFGFFGKDEAFDVSIFSREILFRPGTYQITISVFDWLATQQTTDEISTRLESLYKSFSLNVVAKENRQKMVPLFQISPNEEKIESK